MTPEELVRAEAVRIADFYFPRTRSSREALATDIFQLVERLTRKGFEDGMKMGLAQSGAPLVVQVDGKDAEELERLRANTCACCGDGLLPGPPPLCELCAASYTVYSEGPAHCEYHVMRCVHCGSDAYPPTKQCSSQQPHRFERDVRRDVAGHELSAEAIERWKNEHADQVTATIRAEAPNPIDPFAPR